MLNKDINKWRSRNENMKPDQGKLKLEVAEKRNQKSSSEQTKTQITAQITA